MPIRPTSESSGKWDTSSNADFFDYYARQSLSVETLERFTRVRDKALALLDNPDGHTNPLTVLDIGCGAGTQTQLWAMLGHHVHGLDIMRV